MIMTTRLLLTVALLLLAACATKPDNRLVLPHPVDNPRDWKFPDAR